MMVECEQGLLGVARVGRFVLGVLTDTTTQHGMLKAKVSTLINHLKPLRSVFDEDGDEGEER